jgi:hypothetical protein
LLLAAAGTVRAQSILDADRVEFLPSADDGVVDASGVPLVQSYSMDIFLAGGQTPVETVDLGKPQPDSDGYIRVNFVNLLSTPLSTGVSYEATVASVGPGGTSPSARTNTFGYSQPCSFSLSPSTLSSAAAGGTGSFTVSTGATCQWTAVSQAGWLTVTAGASTTGPGAVSFSVASNTSTAIRNGAILAGGWNFTVVQAAGALAPTPCSYSISPVSATSPVSGGTVSVEVTTADGCSWTASSPVSWAVVSSGASGTGTASVTLTVSKNSSTSSRSATLTIAGQSFALAQQGKNRHR